MTQPSEPNDFQQPLPSSNSNSSTVWIWLAAGLGCGCLSFIVIGILAAIALPSFLNQASKARQAEAKAYLGSITKAQQAYYVEQGNFATSINKLALSLNLDSENYSYQITPQSPNNKSVIITAKAKKTDLKSYTSAVFAIKEGNEIKTIRGICESDRASTTPPAIPLLSSNKLSIVKCPAGSNLLEL